MKGRTMSEPDIETVLVFNEVGQKIPLRLITPLYSRTAYKRLEAENAELKTKLAAEEAAHLAYRRATDLAYRHSDLEARELVIAHESRIESLNMRIARLVDACNQYENNVKPWSVVAMALSDEGDSQWLREKREEWRYKVIDECNEYLNTDALLALKKLHTPISPDGELK
jgi:transcription elongation GreA/GreB family factor